MVLLTVFGIVPAAGLFGVYWFSEGQFEDAFEQRYLSSASSVIETIERNLFERYGDVQAFGLNQAAQDPANWRRPGQDTALVRAMNGYMTGYGIYRAMTLLDLQGNVLAVNTVDPRGQALDSRPAYARTFAGQAWFQDALAGRFLEGANGFTGTTVTEPYQDPFIASLYGDDGFVMVFAAPVRDDNGRIVAIWANFADFALVEDIIAGAYDQLAAEGFGNAELTLLDRSGKVIVDYDPKGQGWTTYDRNFAVIGQLNLADAGVTAAQAAVRGERGSMVANHARKGIAQAAGFAHTQGAYDYPGLGWSALVRVPTDQAFATVKSVELIMELAILATLALALTGGFLIGGAASSPIRAIARAMDRLRQGDTDITLERRSSDEIGDMTDSLNALKDEVARSFQLAQMIKQMPLNIMMADKDCTITYLNDASRKTLQSLEHLLPVKASQVEGSSIDIFHKNPAHKRALLANPANLPHKAVISLGDEKLELNVNAINDQKGQYAGPMLSWSIITDQVRSQAETARLTTMIEEMPINVMLTDTDKFQFVYANRSARETLKSLEHLLPIKADDVIGADLDIFQKQSEQDRKALADPASLPHRKRIDMGDETLDLRISPITDNQGDYVGPMVTWSIITQQVRLADTFESNVKSVVETVSSASTEMHSTAQSMSASAEETNRQASAVAAASEEASTNVQTVASAAEELASSVEEIARQVDQSKKIAGQAAQQAMSTNAQVESLVASSQKVGEVVSLISEIAEQTNLLALNATIEAARAGDAGKGFAVVASEVKSLANQTGKATEEIAALINSIQQATGDSAQSIQAIAKTVEEINQISATVAAAVEEQGAATQEIARNVQQAAAGTQQVSSNIAGVNKAANDSGAASAQVVEAAGELSKQSESLRAEVERFLEQVRTL
ncbi:MAG: methyl-accepting chemotaxis protein [Alphaproteobacteria bacterium]